MGERKNGLLFIAMLQRLLQLHPAPKAIHVVLDNFKIHSSKQVMAWLQQHGARIRLHFLPPYSPEENWIERKWRDLHAAVTRNHRCRTIEELMEQVQRWLDRTNRQAYTQTDRLTA